MKKNIFAYFSVIVLVILVVTACGYEGANSKEIRVFSFSGEDDDIALLNGVAVIGGDREALRGGEVQIKSDAFKNVEKYSASIYVMTEENILIVKKVGHSEGTVISQEEMEGGIGSISAVACKDLDEFKNNLYFKFETVDKNGEKSEHRIPLEVNEVTMDRKE